MRKLYVIFAVVLLLSLSLTTGCGPEKEAEPAKEAGEADYTIQWADPTVEALVRDYIGKPEDDILRSELDFAEEVLILGGAYLFINNENKDGVSKFDLNCHMVYRTEGTRLSVKGEEYELGSIASCEDFNHFRCLKSLELSDTVTADIGALSELKSLESLKIKTDTMPDLGPLEALSNLKTLDLTNYSRNNSIPDINFISGMKRLTRLFVYGVETVDLNMVVELTDLDGLGLVDCNITDIGPLAKLTGLTDLLLSRNNISDVNALGKLTKLEQLLLAGNQISDVSPLNNLKNLTYLDLSGNPVPDVGLLSGLPETCEIINNPTLYNQDQTQEQASVTASTPAAPAQSSPSPDQAAASSTSNSQSAPASTESAAGRIEGIWVDKAGITNSGGMSTLPPAIYFTGNEFYIGNWYSGVTPDDIIADAAGQGYDGPTGTYVLTSKKIKIEWNNGSTVEWQRSGNSFSTGKTTFVPDGGSCSGKFVE